MTPFSSAGLTNPSTTTTTNSSLGSVRLKDNELKDMLDQYVTRRDEEGRGGNVYLTLFMSKNGKACARVFNPNSEAAKEKREAKAASQQVAQDDLPF